MELSIITSCWISFWLLFAIPIILLMIMRFMTKAKKSDCGGGGNRRRPPGPAGWPVVGNMFDLIGSTPHQTLYKLKSQYGPILWLQLGSMNTMIVQSAAAAAELFRNHDLTFSDRKVPDALTAYDFHQGSVAMSSYTPYWRALRRLYSTELMSPKRMNETVFLRRKCIDNLVKWIEDDAAVSRSKGGSGEVEVCKLLFIMGFNIVGNLVLSKDLLEPHSEEGQEFFQAANKFVKWAGSPNVADFIQSLKPLDPMRIKKNMLREMGTCFKIVDGFVNERIQRKQAKSDHGPRKKDFLDSLLEYEGDGIEGPDNISVRNIISFILEMFLAGSETTSSTIEWAMSELMCNPESLGKCRDELDRTIGTNKKVDEADIDKLPYLHAIVKETLRLHPPVPLLLPRNSTEDCIYMGYHIPKETQVFVSVWAIGRDPESWNDPLSFKPERFLEGNVEYKGQHYELIPFGAGRRICAGYSLGHRVVHLTVARLIQSFDWELSSPVTPTVDMSETMGTTLRKLVPLKAIPTKREIA